MSTDQLADDLARAHAENTIVIRRYPGGDVEERIAFPDGSVAERLRPEPPHPDHETLTWTVHWRVTQGENLAADWVAAERRSRERARASVAADWPVPETMKARLREIAGLAPAVPSLASAMHDRARLREPPLSMVAPALPVSEPPADLAALLASIESEIVDAGERCCPDYQQLDWDVLTACYENVKRLVREFAERRPLGAGSTLDPEARERLGATRDEFQDRKAHVLDAIQAERDKLQG